jgi:hypothetical protein
LFSRFFLSGDADLGDRGLGRKSCGMKPAGYETIWIEWGRRWRGWINGAGKDGEAGGLAC